MEQSVKYHLPIRSSESHGINLSALKDFLADGVDVLLTCDTGISANESIGYAQSHGIDVIVTDHHLLPEVLPPAFAVINPRRLPLSHPLSTLPGVGVAYMFAEALLDKTGNGHFSKQLHDLVALGSIADLAELTGDTRYLVQSGIDLIRTSPRPSILAMLKAAEVVPERVSEEHISFILAPRLNAVGRLGDANPMVEFLLSDNAEKISVMVNILEGMNARRKVLCDQVFKGAISLIEQDPSVLDRPVLILKHSEWPAGVVGIVASRLVEIYHRPAILFVEDTGKPLKGSARSIEGIDITAAISQNQEHLLSFGGHPMAAGLALNSENFTTFQRALNHTVELQLDNLEIKQELFIDSTIQPEFLNLELVQKLDMLAPFGPGNPPMIFAAENMRLVETTLIGRLGEHLQVQVEDPNENLTKFIFWHGAGLPLPEESFDLAYTVHSSNYRGQEQVQYEWIDFRQRENTISVDRVTKKDKIHNLDFRTTSTTLTALEKILDTSQSEVWSEGTYSEPIQGLDRFSLKQAEDLVLWSVPPDIETLKALKTVKPDNLYWVLKTPAEHNPGEFLKTLGKLVKQGITRGQSTFSLDQLAALTASTNDLVDLGIKWLTNRGNISTRLISTTDVEIELGGIKNETTLRDVQQSLNQSFREISAFSTYLRRVDLDSLVLELG